MKYTNGLAALVMFLFAACSGEKGAEKQEKIIPVKVMTVAVLQTENSRNYVGTVEESVAVSLAFSTAGTVEQVFVSEGPRVEKGTLLATLNTATAEHSYRMMLAKEQQTQDAYNRLAQVHENGSLPDIKFVEVETGLQQAKSMAAVAKKNLDDCRLYAPRSGMIASRTVEAGSSAMPGVPAFKLVSVDKVNVKIPVPENEIGKIVKGQHARMEVTALDNAVFTGKVEMKSVAANAMSHTYEVKIGVDNPQAELMPGMVCKVSIADDAETARIVVPNRAIRISADGRPYVWLADGNVARRRFVKTGGLNDNGIVVVDGLSVSDSVIVEGFQKVSEGMRVSSITN
ncbi:MAG: efflux RND transporter periplasmic adaptor subunit [Tannerellaceae bacterium]|nr:efflux RND transporter periplasmic adaptor subunit [Tannerellaceae bacterium]